MKASLSGKRILAGLGCLGALTAAKVMVSVMPFKRIIAVAAPGAFESPRVLAAREQGRSLWIGSFVEAVSLRVPWKSRCYDRAVAVCMMLRLLGIPGTVYFGIRKSPDAELSAHAWVRSGSFTVAGAEGSEDYTVLYSGSFPERIR